MQIAHAGVFHQLFVTIGILLSTVLGMKAVFGNASLWFLLYGLFVVPAGINFGMPSCLYLYTRAAIWSIFTLTSHAPAQP
jgi:hypothetical protein